MPRNRTTNPSKLFWQAMDIIEERARLPLHLTYRAVGSSTGQKEFVGDNGTSALNHFGSGDIPMTSAHFGQVVAGGRTMIHVPFAMGGIGVFHSVPASGLGGAPLDLNGCVLAKIFSRQITHWDDAEIKALNPSMTFAGPIKVVHRVHGSSSTAGFTEYLSGKCPASWTLGSGSTIAWPAGSYSAQGSGGMASFIANPDNEGAIGYIDAGHGHANNLGEIELQNKDGIYLTTKSANIGAAGTIALAAVKSVIPQDPTADFSAVNLYDLEGPDTWPITMISYFYLDKDMSRYDPVSAALVMYFVRFILSEEGQNLASSAANMFTKLPEQILNYNAVSLSSITLPANAPTFTTETAADVQVRIGAGEYVISGKRRSYAEVERSANSVAIAINGAELDELHEHQPPPSLLPPPPPPSKSGFDPDTAGALGVAGLILGALGFVLGAAALFMVSAKNRTMTPRSVEIKARDIEVPSSTLKTDHA